MFRHRHDELYSFLEWRRQTRFIRHYGGPIIAVALFAVCLCFVWRARPVRPPAAAQPVEARRPHDRDPFLQASQSPIQLR